MPSLTVGACSQNGQSSLPWEGLSLDIVVHSGALPPGPLRGGACGLPPVFILRAVACGLVAALMAPWGACTSPSDAPTKYYRLIVFLRRV